MSTRPDEARDWRYEIAVTALAGSSAIRGTGAEDLVGLMLSYITAEAEAMIDHFDGSSDESVLAHAHANRCRAVSDFISEYIRAEYAEVEP